MYVGANFLRCFSLRLFFIGCLVELDVFVLLPTQAGYHTVQSTTFKSL